MADKHTSNLPLESSDPDKQKLWSRLEDLPRSGPSAELRLAFYERLSSAAKPSWLQHTQMFIGIYGPKGWAAAALCVLLGVYSGQLFTPPVHERSERINALEHRVAELNRALVLDRLQSQTPSIRLRGILDAVAHVQTDPEVAHALLRRAKEDRVYSVRSAAIDALAPTLSASGIGEELMSLLTQEQSLLVQLALVDLVLRHGNASQLKELRYLANNNQLESDLIDHVNNALGSNRI